MITRAEILVERVVRILAGACVILFGKELIEGGLSKYAPQGAARPMHWALFLSGFIVMLAGATVIRPYWWRRLSRRRG